MTNIWKQFERLTEKGPMVIVEVISHDNGSSTVENTTGHQFIAIGTSVAVGDKAYVKDGEIVGTAPDLPHYGPIYID